MAYKVYHEKNDSELMWICSAQSHRANVKFNCGKM
jgi:hypothetical protein